MPRAWVSLAGPLHRSRSRRAAGPRAAYMASRPSSGVSARSSTAAATPSVSTTTLAHQCMP